MNKRYDFLFHQVSGVPLGSFRALFGICMAYYVLTIHTPSVVEYRYVQPNFFFSFPLFDVLHLPILPRPLMHGLFLVMGTSACMIALGLFFRLACAVFTFSLSYIFLLEQTYASHQIYLYILLAGLLFFTNAHRSLSLDVLLKPQLKWPQVDFWNVFLLRAQICIVYFYSGLSKLFHPDWLRGRQLDIWLKHRLGEHPLWQTYQLEQWAALLCSYAAIAFDLGIGFLLCFKRTRLVGIILCAIFHLTNLIILGIGIEPLVWVMLAALFLFVDFSFLPKPSAIPSATPKKYVIVLLGIYLTIQLLVPFRHWLYAGDVNWTERGHQFSWHLMNNNIDGKINAINFTQPKSFKNFDPVVITPQQRWVMSMHPDMILRYAHKLRDELEKVGVKDPVITVDIVKSLNGRPYAPLIDPTANLATAKTSLFKPSPWILPHPDK